MSLAREIMGGGMPYGQAIAISGGVKTAISAAGTTQGTATALTTSSNLVATATANQGVILPSCQIGDSVMVFNDNTGTTILVYPDVGAKLNNLSTNAGASLGNNTMANYQRVTSTRWVVDMSA